MGTLFRRSRAGKQSNWMAEFTDHRGKRVQRSTRTSDKKTAGQILAHWETQAARRSSGLIDHDKERLVKQSNRPLSEHVGEWIDSLKAVGRSKDHVSQSENQINAVIDHASWQTIVDITPESLERFLSSLRKLDRSNRTVAKYVGLSKQFVRWMVRTGRLANNPLEIVDKPNIKSGRVVNRRMVLPAEWPWLRDASGERALLYETAIQTGLRSNELRSVRLSRMVLAGDSPHILVGNDSTKDKNLAKQHITVSLAAKLTACNPHSANQFFRMPSKWNMADMIRADLTKARENWLNRPDKLENDTESDFLLVDNHNGESLDFHALRHTCGAWLAIQGVHPKTIQAVMRHKSITLTMDTYGHLFPGAEPEAIRKLDMLFEAS